MEPEKLAKRTKASLAKQEKAVAVQVLKQMQAVEASLLAALAVILADTSKAGGIFTPAQLYEKQHLLKAKNQLKRDILDASLKLGLVTSKAQEKAIKDAQAVLHEIADASDTLSASIFEVDSKAIEKLVGYGMNTKTPLAKMYARLGEPTAQRVEQVLVYGITTGQSAQQVGRELSAVMDTTRARALTIARTELNGASREASRIMINQAADSFIGWRWMSTLDNRTCPICWRFHGRVFNTKRKMITHPNCRCTLIAVPKDAEPVETGPEIFAKLKPGAQKAILGPGRFEAYKNGYGLHDLVGYKQTDFGPTPAMRNLSDVLASKPTKAPLLALPDLKKGGKGVKAQADAAAKAPDVATVTPTPPPEPPKTQPSDLDHESLREMYRIGAMHAPGSPWGELTGKKMSYGTVLFDDAGRVLLREPTNHFDGYHWTFPKGKIDVGETAVDTALRETIEETGHQPQITGFVTGQFEGGTGSNAYFLARSVDRYPQLMDKETSAIKWATYDEAEALIKQTTNGNGQKRDLAILKQAFTDREKLLTGKGFEVPKPVVAELRIPEAEKIIIADPGKDIPSSIKGLTKVRDLGGSTGAQLMKDAAGKQFVLKQGNSVAHVTEEYLADNIYRALGVNVPRGRLFTEGGKTYKLTEFIDGIELGKLKGADLDAARARLREDFAVDGLLANYDVVGLGADNILIDKAGQVWRIDNGSSLRFRAQGGAKEFDSHLESLWSMRDKAKNPMAFATFGDVQAYQLGKRMREVATPANEARVLAMLPDGELKTAMAKRFEQMRELGSYAGQFEANDWADEKYIDLVLEMRVSMDKAGIIDALPKSLGFRAGKTFSQVDAHEATQFVDPDGKAFDHLRGFGSSGWGSSSTIETVASRFEAFLKANRASPKAIGDWQSAQAGNSWNGPVQAFKYFLESKLSAKATTNVFWRFGKSQAKTYYDAELQKHGAEVYERSMAAQKAFTMAMLHRVEMHNVDKAAQTIKLVRTENKSVVGMYNLQKGKNYGEQTMEKGLSESYSIVKRTTVHGSESTVQTLAFTDINGIYAQQRAGSKMAEGAFLGDGENEVTAMWRKNKHRLRYLNSTDLEAEGFKK